MSNLSELLPAGAGAKSASFVASGTLGSGVTVGLNSDGTVEAVAITGAAGSIGSPSTFSSGYATAINAVYDTNVNKIVVTYTDYPNRYGFAVVGTVSGTSISFGTPVVFRSSLIYSVSTAFDSANNKTGSIYRDSSLGNLTSIVGTVSGTTISFGSAAVLYGSTVNSNLSMTYDATYGAFVATYELSSVGKVQVGSISGTTISWGSVVTIAGRLGECRGVYDPDQGKTVLFYYNSSNYFTAIVGSAGSSTFTAGTPVVGLSESSDYINAVYDTTSNKMVSSFRTIVGGSQSGSAIVGTVSGTSISFGSRAYYTSGNNFYSAISHDIAENKILVAFRDASNSQYGTIAVGTVSGTSISFSPSYVLLAITFDDPSFGLIYDPDVSKNLQFYADGSNSNLGKGIVFTPNTLASNNTDFIGITDQAIADTATGAVIVQGGVSSKLSGLTVGADYYVQDDGSLGSPTVAIPYNIVGSTYVQNFSVAAQDTAPTGIAFNTDGTKMFVVGFTNDSVYEYALSTGFNVSTASYSQNFSVSAQDTDPEGIAFNTDGTKMYLVGRAGQDINEYTLSTGFDISTATYSQNFSVSAQDTAPTDIAFNVDGTKMFVVGRTSDNVNEYTLATGFDVSTASYSQNFSVASEQSFPEAMTFNSDGTKMFITGQSPATVFLYTLSTGFDVSTAAYSSVSFSVSAQEGTPTGIKFNNDGTKMFIVGRSGDEVNEYSTGAGSVTSAPAGRALSTTSILLEG